MADSPLLTAGLAHAKALAILPADADFALLAVKDGDWLRLGVVTKVGERWTLSADLGIQPTKKEWTGQVAVIGKW